MPVSQLLNPKATIKKNTTNDIPFAPQQPVINSYYATSTASQTVINYGFSIQTTGVSANTDIFWLFVDGKKLDLGASNDYQFTSVAADGSSSQVTLNLGLAAGLNIQAFKLGLKKESEFGMDNRFVQNYTYQAAINQPFVSQTDNIMVATATGGTPASGFFYSSISGRSAMVDLSKDLKPRFGVDRIATTDLSRVVNEFGPNGEPVYTVPSDSFNQIRFVGGGWNQVNANSGNYIASTSTTDYIEVTFYGTGLNLNVNLLAAAYNFSYAINGGSSTSSYSLTANAFTATRNYNNNNVIPMLTSTQMTLGINTVKITQSAAGGMNIYALELLHQPSGNNISINPGVSYSSGKQVTTSAQTLASYSAPVTGTRGGRVVVYQTSAGALATSFNAAATSSSTLASTNHSNEEIVRKYGYNEFGAGRTDDFSYYALTGLNAAFTLEDGTTSLAGFAATRDDLSNTVFANGNAQWLVFTFVGTGVDIVELDTATTIDSHTFILDGTSLGSVTNGFTELTKRPIASGLAYGTHTLKILRNAAVTPLRIFEFVVYQPLTPTLPAGAIQLGSYNVLANYVANTTTDNLFIAQGTLRKTALREENYIGTGWQFAADTNNYSQLHILQTITVGDSTKFTFFGTGFEFRWMSLTNSATNVSVNVDGATNYTVSNSSPTNGVGWTGSLTTSVYGGGSVAFTASTGVLNQVTAASGGADCGLQISGMTLGTHTITLTWTSGGSAMRVNWFDIITPIHSLKLSNTFTTQLGSVGMSDDRSISPLKNVSNKKVRARVGGAITTASVSTAAGTYVPMPEMNLVINLQNAGYIQASFSGHLSTSAGAEVTVAFFIDGKQYGPGNASNAGAGANEDPAISLTDIMPLSAGIHTIAVYWSGASSLDSFRTFNVIEL